MALYWFHAFNRFDVASTLSVLRDAAGLHPDPNHDCRIDERDLGIGPHVYAYLGRTKESFGRNAVVLPLEAMKGEVSPFDTGGLLRKIKPVCTRTSDARKKYLRDHSWPTSALSALLEKYPSEKNLVSYVRMTRPSVDGPHAVLPVPTGGSPEPIWKENEDWRAWTWEGRSPKSLPTGARLYRWTCPSNVYPKLVKYVATRPSAERAWFGKVQKLYVSGGLTRLLGALRVEQETP